MRKLVVIGVVAMMALGCARSASAQNSLNQLFLGNFGVSTVGLTPLARQNLVPLINLQLAQYAQRAALGNLAGLLEQRRLAPILNCNAPAASSQAFAFNFTSCQIR